MEYRVVQRVNVHRKSKKEYALDIKLDSDWWTFVSYEKKPNNDKIKELLELFQRACAILQPHIKKEIYETFNNVSFGEFNDQDKE